jgi:5'-3' exonuclease
VAEPALTAEQERASRAFAAATQPDPPRVLVRQPGPHLVLIDLSGLFWASWHATADQELSEAFGRTVEAVHRIAGEGDLVAVCCDSPPYWRREILPSYKAHREAAPPQSLEQFERVKERLRTDGFLLWAAPGFEADDVIAWAVSRAKSDPAVGHVTIASSDKDLRQLVGERVHCYSPASRATYDADGVREKHGVAPEAMGDFLALLGDRSDNVLGVPGVGEKTSAALLIAFGTLENVLAEAAKPDAESKITKPKIKAALVEHAETARLARKVITLRTDISLDWKEVHVERQPEPIIDMPTDDEPEAETQKATVSNAAPANGNGKNSTHAAIARAEPMAEGAALAPAAPEWSLGLEPATLAAAHKLAQYLVNSRLYSRFPNAEAIWAVIIRGREMGMGALEALDNFHIIEGRPAPTAHCLIGRAMRNPRCEYFVIVETNDTRATYETKARGTAKPVSLTYTIEDAKRAGVCPAEMRSTPPKEGKDSRGNWEKRPAEMLRKTAGVQLVRVVYPESLGGAYAYEELDGSR